MFKLFISKLHAPRWVVFVIDVAIVCFSITVAYLLRFNFSLQALRADYIGYAYALILSVRVIGFLIAKTYQGLVRYTGTNDAIRIGVVVSAGSVVLLAISLISRNLNYDALTLPLSIIVMEAIITVVTMTISRFIVKFLYFDYQNNHGAQKQNVVIYGANEFALTTKRTLDRDSATDYNVVAFIDANNILTGKSIDGAKIYPYEQLTDLITKNKVTNLIFAGHNVSKTRKQEIIDICLQYNVKVMSTPNVTDWINGELSFKQIKNIRIEDLLERDPICLDEQKIRKEVLGKVILVTGAAGSIGSEIVRQLTKFNPGKIIVFDQAESPLYDLELELREKLNFTKYEIVIGSVIDELRLTKTFETYHPSVVYHAAAYKHVPMMESNPSQAIKNNVYGTKLLADISVKYNVSKFVMVSTDKAVNPTNVMGCSKRICEIYTQSLNNMFPTKFITTRFGNVLGSNGSVIPRFKQQIENGGPVTVTHPDINRFFMTIPEACQLVLQAATLGNGGEVFVFDMGKSVKIIDLAKKMIKLSGLTLGRDIQIQFTGLRPGEKLYEEVLSDKEKTLPTSHSQIMVAKVRQYDFAKISQQISELIGLVKTNDNFKIVAAMKHIVPEFKSENSIYEELDLVSNQDNTAELSDNANYQQEDNNNTSSVSKTNGVSVSKKFSLIR